MTKFTPYQKLSKKERRRLDTLRRGTWGDLNPVTRRSENKKAYNRNKARKIRWDDSFALCYFLREPHPGAMWPYYFLSFFF